MIKLSVENEDIKITATPDPTTSNDKGVNPFDGPAAADIPTGPEPRTLEILEEAEEEAEDDRARRSHA